MTIGLSTSEKSKSLDSVSFQKKGKSTAQAIDSNMSFMDIMSHSESSAANRSQTNRRPDTVKTESQTDHFVLREKMNSSVVPEKIKTPEENELEQSEEMIATVSSGLVEFFAIQLDQSLEAVQSGMDELGICGMQLLNPKVAGMLYAHLTNGQNTAQLLLSDEFQQFSSRLTELISQMSETMGMTVEEMKSTASRLLENAAQIMDVGEEINGQQVVTNKLVSVVQSDIQKDQSGISNTADMTDEQFQVNATYADEAAQQQLFSTEDQSQSAESKNSDSEINTQTTSNPFINIQKSLDAQSGQQVAQHIDSSLKDILSQLSTEIRSQLTQTQEFTRFQMQLNPENLGKLYVSITEAQGTVKAQIAASDEVVRTMLSAQVADLKMTLNQQGIKVDAIEVTIATHEYEQNLQGNFHSDQNLEQRASTQDQGRRSELMAVDSEESDIMLNEKEELTVNMMKEQGNRMDIIA